ncbi:hypothetical protein ON010_g3882 [Phytophthora cinnamomi]|nr:hypothetical protein ON010_g3882 [Phytophthora cinnamomi]
MARRTTESLSAAMGSAAEGSVVDDETGGEAWLCRSTVCVSDGEKDDDSDVETCSWSQLNTPAPFGGELDAKMDGENSMGVKAGKGSTEMSSRSPTKKMKRMLPRIPGFSNSEALRTQLPRSTVKQSRIRHIQGVAKEAEVQCKTPVTYAGASEQFDRFSPSKDEVAANRRKWDLERKLQDADQMCDSIVAVNDAARKRNLKRKLQTLNPVALSAAEVEANQRKWDLEKRLQEEDRIVPSMMAEASGAPPKQGFRQRLQNLNPFTMNPVVPSAAEIEFNRRKWDLERRLQDEAQVGGSLLKNRSQQALAPLIMNPVVLSGREVEANRRKWELERNLQEADRSVAIGEGRRTAGPKHDSSQKLEPLHPVVPFVDKAQAQAEGQKWSLERKLCDLEDRLERKRQVPEGEAVERKLGIDVLPSPSAATSSQDRSGFEMSSSLVYLLLFFSTAVVHCAIFNFNLELRQFLRLDIYPFGVLLLFSWIFVGLIHFVGGLVGDLVRNRVLLLQRIAALWGFAVIALHVAAFQLPPVVSSISLVLGLVCAGVAHGSVCPNVVALRVESQFYRPQSVFTPMSPEDDNENSSEDDSEAESENSCSSDDSSVLSEDEQPYYDLASHNFFSGCFAARLAGSSLVQAYYFLLVDVNTFTDDGFHSPLTSRGFHCMLLMSFGLLASFIYFCFKSWGNCQNNRYPGQPSLFAGTSERQKFENKLAILEQGFNASVKVIWTWSWKNLVQLCNRALVGYALLAFVMMTLIGTGFSVVLLFASHTSLSVRLVAFLLIVVGWLLTMIAGSRQLNPTKKQLLRECRRLGLRSRQLYLVIFAVAFICVSGCVSFLRAQLYTTMVVQVCQTRLLIPGTTNTLFNPELLGVAVGTSSLILIGLTRMLSGDDASVRPKLSSLTMSNNSTPATPVFQKTHTSFYQRLLPCLASCPPVTRMCFAMLLYLVSIFLSSVVELYRRKAAVNPSVLPRSCGSVHSDFAFLWTLPYVVLLGASDALFRVSLQEQCHELARDSIPSSATRPPRRWAGAVQGAISLAEALGYTTALALVAVLSRWLFRPELTDMALLFLLLTTVVALTHALLNRIAARAQAYQRSYSPIRCPRFSS